MDPARRHPVMPTCQSQSTAREPEGPQIGGRASGRGVSISFTIADGGGSQGRSVLVRSLVADHAREQPSLAVSPNLTAILYRQAQRRHAYAEIAPGFLTRTFLRCVARQGGARRESRHPLVGRFGPAVIRGVFVLHARSMARPRLSRS
jgi:hypothetical protein